MVKVTDEERQTLGQGPEAIEKLILERRELIEKCASLEAKLAEKPPHRCAAGMFGASVMLSDGTKVCLNRGENAHAAHVWLTVQPAERVIAMDIGRAPEAMEGE